MKDILFNLFLAFIYSALCGFIAGVFSFLIALTLYLINIMPKISYGFALLLATMAAVIGFIVAFYYLVLNDY